MFCCIDVEKTGRNIKRLREKQGLSVRELAESFSGMASLQTIYCWQKGEYLPSYENLLTLSSIFGTPVEEIIAHTFY